MPNAYAISLQHPQRVAGLSVSTAQKSERVGQGMWLALTMAATVFCVANYIYQVNNTATRGFEMRTLEKRINQLTEIDQNLENSIVRLQSMQSLQQQVVAMGYVPVQHMEYLGQQKQMASR